MRWILLFLIFALPLSAWQLSDPLDSNFLQFKNGRVIMCSTVTISPPPTFTEPDCQNISVGEINPHQQTIWVRGVIETPEALLNTEHPVGLFLSVKAASRVYMNDQLIGQSGVPALSFAAETPGALDTVFYVPKHQFKKNDNTITMLLSGQHSRIPSSQSLLTIGFGPYLKSPHHGRTDYWVALITFGVFLVGAIYFGVVAKLKYKTLTSITLSLASIFACLQLSTEVARGFWAYPYPFHDLRLVLICTFSLGVGFALAFHTLDRFKIHHRYVFLIGMLAITVLGFAVIPSFDGKASWAILVPTLAAGAGASLAVYQRQKNSIEYTVAFFCFTVLILTDPGQFLDKYYYFVLMALLVSLFIQQAFIFQAAIRDHGIAENGRLKLEAALQKATPSQPIYLLVKSAGKQERINVETITALSGAGDYVTLRLMERREVLHKGSLAALQKTLPEHFLSVHRSHIVNTNHIQELKRLPSGVGELQLLGDCTVPVSRRLMPRMRKQLLNKST